MVLAVILTLAGAAAPMHADAVNYNDTNPGATPCGDGSHPVEDWQTEWVKNAAGLKIALVEVRRSDYCNTLWTRVTNETGRGSGYAAAATETVTENIYVYSCPQTSCLVAHYSDTDTLSKYGTSPYQGWSHQHVVPAGTNLGTPPAKQPPAFQGTGKVTISGTSVTAGTGLQPVFTQLSNSYANSPLSCNNTVATNASRGVRAADRSSRSTHDWIRVSPEHWEASTSQRTLRTP